MPDAPSDLPPSPGSQTWSGGPITVETYEAESFVLTFQAPWDYPSYLGTMKAQRAPRVRLQDWNNWDYWDPDNGFSMDESHYSDEDGDYWTGWEMRC
jgi:hypothetical protein